MFEYACHEGNYGMVNILAGARAQEREAERGEVDSAWEHPPRGAIPPVYSRSLKT